ncbi:MAG: prolyl oligopeptidase family serine peptidase [Gemmatimonadales bacterium]|nr:prolyl oligopeptidase family serine peptidase [Gemmatimonadales bacterium]
MTSLPLTPRDDVLEVLHGTPVADPYRWLEDGESAAARAWTAAQNAYTAAWLRRAPRRAAVRQRLETLLHIGAIGCPRPARGRYVYQRRDGGQDQPVLYVRDGVDGPERVALDPNVLAADGTTALDWYHVSDDGRILAYGLSEGGTERSVLHLLDLDTLAPLPDRIPGTRAADVAWLPDGSGFYYTRYPLGGAVPAGEEHYHRAVWFHRLGDEPSQDALVFQPAEKEHWPGVSLSDDGRWLLIAVQRTFERSDLYIRPLDGSQRPLVAVARDLPASFEGRIVRGTLYLRTNLEATTYRLFAVDPVHPEREAWHELVPPRDDAVLATVMVTRRHLVLEYLVRAASRLELAALDGSGARELLLPTLGSVFGLAAESGGDELFAGFSSYTTPPTVYRWDLDTLTRWKWASVAADVDPERYVVEQVAYPSRDGTEVTMFLVHDRAVTPDGNRPVYLTGYGGFNVPMQPGFSRSYLLWLERGGVLAVPNLRGGGEYGEHWHQQGMLGEKQRTFDDCIAAAEWLVRAGWTRPERLAVAGGSNGGLLVGAVVTQRPDLFGAAVCSVPLLDMLRYHRFLIARLWIPEYGDPDDPEQFRWLAAYSPYHRVKDGERYPAVLLTAAEGDSRVDPLHARKMAARLQAATASGRPVLLRIESRAGHGAGKPVRKVLDELTDCWTFVCEALGVT